MDELVISPEYVERLILKARAVMMREGLADTDADADEGEEEHRDTLHEETEDLTREELVEELEGLDNEHRNALVALMWLGRGDAEPDDWQDLMTQADERREIPTADYLLGHPLVADYWAEGLERLGYRTTV